VEHDESCHQMNNICDCPTIFSRKERRNVKQAPCAQHKYNIDAVLEYIVKNTNSRP